jgi:NAD(P)-dependent dehydrogenase (short-subunit alcohol dehydrogenase family)
VSDSLPLNRRQLLAGTAAVAALSAMPATGQEAPVETPDLGGTSILITGCSSGFGHIGALLYARAGAKVIATMRNLPRPEANTLRATAIEEGLDLHIVEIDVLSDDQVAAGVAEAEQLADGALDVLINNAGIGMGGPAELQDMAALEAMFGTNVFGYQRMARAVLPGMRSRGSGYIINISSQLGRVIVPNIGSYSATKFAVEAMSEQMAYELVARGVDVTIVEPGGFPTRIWASGDRYTSALLERTSDERKAAYPALVGNSMRGGGGSTDPADVPRAIAALIAMPAGSRPLRRPVHPGRRPQEAINQVSAQVQRAMLGNSPYGPWVDSVLN